MVGRGKNWFRLILILRALEDLFNLLYLAGIPFTVSVHGIIIYHSWFNPRSLAVISHPQPSFFIPRPRPSSPIPAVSGHLPQYFPTMLQRRGGWIKNDKDQERAFSNKGVTRYNRTPSMITKMVNKTKNDI